MNKVRVGLVGSGFVSTIHAESLKRVAGAQMVAVTSPTGDHAEKHDGPHSAWFWDVEKSGGGVTLDMGCHAFEYFRWLLGKPANEGRKEKKKTASGEQTQSHETPLGTIVPLRKPRATSVYA